MKVLINEDLARKIASAKSWLKYAKESKERGRPNFYNYMKNDLESHGINIEEI